MAAAAQQEDEWSALDDALARVLARAAEEEGGSLGTVAAAAAPDAARGTCAGEAARKADALAPDAGPAEWAPPAAARCLEAGHEACCDRCARARHDCESAKAKRNAAGARACAARAAALTHTALRCAALRAQVYGAARAGGGDRCGARAAARSCAHTHGSFVARERCRRRPSVRPNAFAHSAAA
jgi:hypothetical protein